MNCSLPCSSVHGILQARILKWVAISFSRRSSQPRDQTGVFCTVGRSLPSETPGKSKEKSYCEIVCCLPVLIQYPFAFPHPAMILEVLPSAGEDSALCSSRSSPHCLLIMPEILPFETDFLRPLLFL